MRVLTLVMLAIVALLQYRIWFGQYGAGDLRQLQADVERQAESNNALKQRNELLYADIEDLREAHEAIEERARNELGMVKPEETFFRLIDKDNNPQ
ncbi:cell division protein FtsB [Aliidiomarina celeris]|uniref:cell division protein FtsB n=1 Tax=Aliidiomarina celeris TaxID=2249428 RepID=UPI000DE85CC4|nr:cell division protein FtsB [Aliidiomarina celeris]